jgi:hypothetical protein
MAEVDYYPEPPDDEPKTGTGISASFVLCVIFWLTVGLCLISCGPVPKPEVQYVTIEHTTVVTPDESSRHCIARPKKPDLSTDPSAAVSNALADAMAYGDDCSSKLDATWQAIDSAKEKVK